MKKEGDKMTEQIFYFEGCEMFFADLVSEDHDLEDLINAFWVSQR